MIGKFSGSCVMTKCPNEGENCKGKKSNSQNNNPDRINLGDVLVKFK